MIIPITWLQYWKMIGIIAVIYYAVIIAFFFRSDITARHRKKLEPESETTAG